MSLNEKIQRRWNKNKILDGNGNLEGGKITRT